MICRYGLKCQNPNCAFGHPERKVAQPYDTSKIPCVHFRKGRCNKGADCKFLHDLSYAFVSPEQQRKTSSAGASVSVSPSQVAPEDPPKESEEEQEEPELTESEFSVEEIGPVDEEKEKAEPMEVDEEQVSEEVKDGNEENLQGVEPVGNIEETVLTPPETELSRSGPLSVDEMISVPIESPIELTQILTSELVSKPESPVPEVNPIGNNAEPEPAKPMTPEPLLESPPSFEQLSPVVFSPERVKPLLVASPKVEGRSSSESPQNTKIIKLPSSAKPISTAKTTKMPRQQRQINEVTIKTLEQIKREKEEQRKSKEGTNQSVVPLVPELAQQTSPKVTQMARVTLIRTNSKTQSSNISSEPEPIKKPKIAETVEPKIVEIVPEVRMSPGEEVNEPNPLIFSDSSVDAGTNEEIYSLIAEQSRPQDHSQDPIQEPNVELQPLNVDVESITPELAQPNPILNESPNVFETQQKSPPEVELESGEIPQTYQEPVPSLSLLPQPSPVAEVFSEPLQVQSPASVEVNSLPEVPASPPQLAPSNDARMIQLPQKSEKGKQQVQTTVPSTTKKVIALPSISKKTGPGQILTLEEIKERKRAAQEAHAKDQPKPEVKVAPGAGLKRPRDDTVPQVLEPVKRPKPTSRPVSSPSESLGDWEPLATAMKDLDFSNLEEGQTAENVQALKEIALRLSTSEGFLELLDEMEEKVTALEVAKGLKPEPDPEFMVRCKSDVIARGAN